jgi:hypothetical protein
MPRAKALLSFDNRKGPRATTSPKGVVSFLIIDMAQKNASPQNNQIEIRLPFRTPPERFPMHAFNLAAPYVNTLLAHGKYTRTRACPAATQLHQKSRFRRNPA